VKLASLVLQGFRCYGPDSTEVFFDDLSAVIGPNAAGKTTLLLALQRLFGVSSGSRRIVREDFWIRNGEKIESAESRSMRLEARLDLPEIGTKAGAGAAASTFDQMIIEEPGGEPYVRIELKATWDADGTLDGEVRQELSWITTPSDEDEAVDNSRKKVSARDRGSIRAIYIPAARDPASEVRAVAGTALHALLGAVKWSSAIQGLVEEQFGASRNQFAKEPGIALVNEALGARWKNLHRDASTAITSLEPTAHTLAEVVRQMRPLFDTSEGGREHGVEGLSDGERSLFALAFQGALLDVEQRIVSDENGEQGSFDLEKLAIPLLTLLTVEEPENHLSPQHLGRVLQALRSSSQTRNCQVVLTSHSPAVLARVEPTEIRYCRGDEASSSSTVKELVLPPEEEEAFKYVREAVRKFPELYFSRLVALGEGPSEEVVLPALFRAVGLDLDANLVTVAPLGGRHVNHMWRLLNDLEIPHVTLLDLDTCRDRGAWGRIHYACNELLKVGVKREELLDLEDGNVLSAADFAEMPHWDPAAEGLESWLTDLESHGVFFSRPLDLDLSMLVQFEKEYRETTSAGPRVPDDGDELQEYLERAIISLLGETDQGVVTTIYSEDDIELFPWYRYIFLHRSKPVAHAVALRSIESERLSQDAPPELLRMAEAVRNTLAIAPVG
jgi:energy-coupling factor transporter ATP-binding protein EcfA2